MTQEEFTQRTGITPIEDEFAKIHEMYMSTSLDKDEFCKHYNESLNNPIVENILKGKIIYQNAYKTESKKLQTVFDMLFDTFDPADEEVNEQLVSMLGQREVTLRKIRKGIALNADDVEYIEEHLR